MNSLLTLITYSHTDYLDLLPIILDGVKSNPLSMQKYFACNRIPENSTEILSVYDKIIEYDTDKPFPQKVLQCLEHVTTPFVFFVHDIDIFINVESSKLQSLMDFITSLSVDRFILGCIKPNKQILSIDDIYITPINSRNLSDHFYTPYDVGPSIWKVSTFKDALNHVKDVSYRDIEDSQIQNFLLDKSVYAITNLPNNTLYKAYYQLGRPFPSFCSFLHIVLRGKFLLPSFYHDLESVFLDLIKKHNIDINLRGVNADHYELKFSRSV